MEDEIKTPDIPDITDESGFVKEDNDSIIKVIGVGGGGSNAVNYMYSQKIPHVNFVICNTDRQHLERSPVPNKVLLGEDITHGLGAGNVPDVGRKCAEASREDIQRLFDDKTEMVFVTAGMGGGTGTGAGPVVAELAKEAGMLTIGIVTVPFKFEGEKKIYNALEGAKEMKKHVDALLIINNENLIDLYPDLDFFNAFGKADDTLANAARSISDIISQHCYVNVDFQDVKTTLKGAGTAIIATAEADGEHRVTDAIKEALHSPLLKTHDIFSARRILFKFVCSREHPIMVHEVGDIREFTSQLPSNIEVKWGIGANPEMGESVKVTVLASGFDMTLRDNEAGANNGPIILDNNGRDYNNDEERELKIRQRETQKEIISVYGAETVKEFSRASDENRYVVLKPSQFDDHDVIALLEAHRAYMRPTTYKEEINRAGQAALKAPEPEKKNYDAGAAPITF